MVNLIQGGVARVLLVAVSLVVGPAAAAAAFVRTTSHSGWASSSGIPPASVITLMLSSTPTTITTTDGTTPSAPVESVLVLEDAAQVGAEIRRIVKQAAAQAIAERGHFALAIPGGSVLKMLVGSTGGKDDGDDSWTAKTTLAYVNHKCVAMDDADLATHAKASKLFLNDWKGVHAILMNGTNHGPEEAAAYETKLRALPASVLPVNSKNGMPIFDLALIGVGDDGHIGSLYPGREEVLVGADADGADGAPWVLPVEMKQPPSITLSFPVMAGAKQVVVAACGVSDKYPQGKSAGMRRAIVAEDETLSSFPAVGLRGVATWIMDKAAASKLGDAYCVVTTK